MAKTFNVNILLNILTQGVEGAVRLITGELQPAVDKLNNSAKDSAKGNQIILDSFDKLKARIDEITSKTPINLRTEEQAKELDILKKALFEFVRNAENAAVGAKILRDTQKILIDEGISGYAKVEDEVKKLSNALKALDDIKIGGTESVQRLQELLKKLQKGADIKLDVDSATAIEETKQVEKNLRQLLDEAAKGGDLEGFKNISNVLNQIRTARTELEKLISERDKLDAKPAEVRVRIKEETPKIRQEIEDFKKEFETAKSIGLGVQFRSEGANERLNEILKRIKEVKKDAESIGQDTVDLDVNFNKVVELKKQLTEVGKRKDRIAREAITVKVTNTNELKNLEAEARKLLVDIEAAKKAGNIELVAKLDVDRQGLVSRLQAIKDPIDKLAQSAKKQGLVEAFESVNSKLIAAEKSAKDFDASSVKAVVDSQREAKKLADQLSDLSVGSRKLKKDISDAFSQGAVGAKSTLSANAQELLGTIQKIQNSSETLSNKQLQVFRGLQREVGNSIVKLNSLDATGTKAGNDVQNAIATLGNSFNKSKKEVSGLVAELNNAQKIGNAAVISPRVEIKADNLRVELEKQLLEAQRLGQTSLAKGIRSQLDQLDGLKTELKSTTALKDALNKTDIRVRVSSTKELKDLDKEARNLLVDIEKAKKSGNINLVVDLDTKRANLESKLNSLQTGIENISNATKKTGLVDTFEGIRSKLVAADKSISSFSQAEANAAQQAIQDNQKISDSISDIIRKTRQLASEVEKDKATGNTQRQPEFLSRASALNSDIQNIANVTDLTNKQLDNLNRAKSKLDSTTKSVNNLTQASVATGEAAQEASAKLANDFSKIGSKFADLQKKLNQAKEAGNAFSIKPQIDIDANTLLSELKTILAEAQRLGKNTTSIRLKIDKVEDFINNLNTISVKEDEINRKKITVKAELDARFKEVDRELAELNRELEAAKKKGDIRLVVSLQTKLDSVRGELAKIEPLVKATNDKSKLELFDKRKIGIDIAQKQINDLGNSAPGILKKLGTSFRLAASDAGGARGAITGVASAFRLIGTSAFVAQLRSVGFAFSALANIVQNIGPVFFQFGAGLAKAGPPGIALLGVLTAIGTTAIVVAGKLALITGALGSIVETGFKYNSSLEQTKNASAALAQEFFDFSVNGEKVNETVEIGGKVLTKYQVAQLAVEQQFQGLQSAALTTIFTNQELLGTFQNIVLASKGLAPSLESVTALTGQFARVAGLIGISADKLASQVNLVLSGAGRVTSPLQRFLNAAKDSKGIELTAKRIKELRAQGGDVLFAELTTAISKFDEALKVANRASFAGVISNFQDLFEQISQIATKDVFNSLRDGLANVVERLTQKVKVLKDDGSVLKNLAGEDVTDVRPAKALLNIADTASRIFSVIEKDIIKLINFIVDNLDNIAKVLSDNYTNIINIYESLKDVLATSLKIVSAFTRIFTLSSDTNDQLKATSTLLDGIVIVADVFRGTLDLISLTVNGIVALIGTIPLLFSEATLKASQFDDYLFNGNNESEGTKAIRERTEAIEDFVAARAKAAQSSGQDLVDSAKDIGDITTGKRSKERTERIIEEAKQDQTNRILKGFEERKDKIRSDVGKNKLSQSKGSEQINKIITEENDFRKLVTEDINLRKSGKEGIDFSKFEKNPKITSKGTGKGTSDESKGKQKSQKSELADRKAFVDEVRKLGIQREQNELKLVQDRLAQEKDLTDAALEQNLISQQAASKKLLDIKNQETDNEITTRKNALALLDAERLDKIRAFEAEKTDIENNAVRTKEPKAVTQSKLDVLDLKQSTELIANKREQVKLEGEIAALTQSKNSASLEYLKTIQGITKENRKALDDAQRSLADAQDLNDEETLRFRLLDLAKSKIEEIINIENQSEGIDKILVGETDQRTIAILTKQQELLANRKLLIEQEISVRQRLLQLQTLDNLASELKNQLASEEAELTYKVNNGYKSERDALVQATAQRIKYKEALEKIIAQEKELLNAPVTTEEQSIANAQRRDNLKKLEQELRELKTVVDDKELINATNSIKDNFVSFFDSIQEGSKSATDSIADLGKSILATFRNLISKRITEELFGSLFPTPGQTEGKVTGLFGKLFDKLGLGTASQDQKKAEELAKKTGTVLDPRQQAILDNLQNKVTEGNIGVVNSINELKDKIKAETADFAAALEALTAKIKEAGTVLGEKNPNSAKTEAQNIIKGRVNVNSKAAEEALNSPELGGKPLPVTVKGLEIDGSDKGTIKTVQKEASKEGAKALDQLESSTFKTPNTGEQPQTQNFDIKASVDRIISSVNISSEKITSAISSASYKTQPISIADSGQILPTLSTYFSSLGNTISVVVGAKLDEVIRLLSTAGSVSSSQSPLDILGGISGGSGEGNYRGGVIRRAFGGFISKGAVKATGGFREDSVPARLSNGEYVIQQPVVKSLGQEFFDYVNSTGVIPAMAAGGSLLQNFSRSGYTAPTIDTSKYDYSGGGAKLLKLPDAIVEPEPPKPKKIGGLRKFFGNLLSGIAPFLNFIPVIGPFLAIGAGAAGGALLGEDKKSAIIGGILGGLGNAGGLGKFGGALGSFGKFFGSSGTGGKALSIFSGLGGSGLSNNNFGSGAGNILLKLFQRFGKLKTLADGGIANFADGGLSKIFSGFGDKNNSTGQLALLLGLSTLLGKLSNNQNAGQEFTEVVVDDPDAERKNKYGSAYRPLIDAGIIPDYKYSDKTLQALLKQQEGYKNVIRTPKKSGFLSFLTQLLPVIGGLIGGLKLGGTGASKSLVDAPFGGGGGNPLGDVFAAGGGLIKYLAGGGSVTGAGTSTSDSIPAMLSNGEYVIKASSVRMLGTDILDSINAGRFKFADGGLASTGIETLPEAHPATANNVNLDGSVSIVNVLDPNLLSDFLRTPDGQRQILNVISKNKKSINQNLR